MTKADTCSLVSCHSLEAHVKGILVKAHIFIMHVSTVVVQSRISKASDKEIQFGSFFEVVLTLCQGEDIGQLPVGMWHSLLDKIGNRF